MESLDDIVESCLSQIQISQGLIPVFAEMWAGKSDFSKQDIEDAMRIRVQGNLMDEEVIEHSSSVEQVVVQDSKEIKKIPKKPLVLVDKSVPIPKLSGHSWGLKRREHERKMSIMTQIRSIVLSKDGQGLTRTGILKRIRKDNSHWRYKINGWLDEMEKAGIVKKVGKRYYSPQANLETRERMLHRLVFESLEDGPLSTTAIANRIGCGGGNQRAILRSTINDLCDSGFIRLEGIRWRWIR